MRSFVSRARPSVIGIAVVAVLSIAGIATANKTIRDGSINTRDIKDNQVNTRDIRNDTITTRDVRDNQLNTRDLRDGSIRGVDLTDSSVGLADLSPEANAALGSTTVFDPRAHGASGCCLSWARGPETVAEAVPGSANPIANQGAGQLWRSAVLDPGTYVVQTTGQAAKVGAATEGAATRLFLGGQPVGDGRGYTFYPVPTGSFPVAQSSATVIQVAAGTDAQRQLVQRAISLGDPASLEDNLLIWKVTPR